MPFENDLSTEARLRNIKPVNDEKTSVLLGVAENCLNTAWSLKRSKIQKVLQLGHFPSWRNDNPLAITLAHSPHMTDGLDT